MAWIQTDDTGRILAVSSANHVCEDDEIEVELPEGFVEAECIDWKYADGSFEKDPLPKPARTEIAELKAKLAETDYVALKAMDAMMKAASAEEQKAALTGLYSDYGDVLEQRQAWRDRINDLEKEVTE